MHNVHAVCAHVCDKVGFTRAQLGENTPPPLEAEGSYNTFQFSYMNSRGWFAQSMHVVQRSSIGESLSPLSCLSVVQADTHQENGC